jgi:hypothetical protein
MRGGLSELCKAGGVEKSSPHVRGGLSRCLRSTGKRETGPPHVRGGWSLLKKLGLDKATVRPTYVGVGPCMGSSLRRGFFPRLWGFVAPRSPPTKLDPSPAKFIPSHFAPHLDLNHHGDRWLGLLFIRRI